MIASALMLDGAGGAPGRLFALVALVGIFRRWTSAESAKAWSWPRFIGIYTLTCVALLASAAYSHGAEPSSNAPAFESDQPTAVWAAANYQDFERITPTPVLADPTLLVACTTLTQAGIDQQLAKEGPHALIKISIFMNQTAAQAFRAKDPRYPVGSIVVKEKALSGFGPIRGKYRLDEPSERTDTLARMAGSGGMIKRAPGYDPAHGDWEYFYFTDPKIVEHGKIATCVECHERARTTDRVYGSWAKH